MCSFNRIPLPDYHTLVSPASRETFGRLLDIPDRALMLLATNIRAKRFGLVTRSSRVTQRIVGTLHVSHIVQLDDTSIVIRVPAAARDGDLSHSAEAALQSQAATLELGMSGSAGPQLYQFDTTSDNEIAAPYICTSYVPQQNLRNS
ncbi:hypothetical protein FZEAL_7054 [Fusarium zealandicum]|uniref:Uncharacterized protein n=1 Tax=Fusarium zealandicum TaxID=1053134 RepID=A0A8H4XJ91_9HYPO|nr:hypothetical protein FZEAL_7054 [Fusarium zealandicum]